MLHPLVLRFSAMFVLLNSAGALGAEPDVTVTDGRLQVIMTTRPAAGYFQLRNNGADQVTLTGARAPDCSSLMLHKSSNAGGMSSMQMVGSVQVPPHGVLRFEPGDYHLMCMDPSGPLLAGKGVEPVTLEFAGGAKVIAQFAIIGVGR